jgi:hypothetical protein
VWAPTLNVVVENVAAPWAFNCTCPILTPPSLIATLPDGMPVGLLITTVKDDARPANVVAAVEVKVAVVAVDCTTSTTIGEVLEA